MEVIHTRARDLNRRIHVSLQGKLRLQTVHPKQTNEIWDKDVGNVLWHHRLHPEGFALYRSLE